MVPGVKVKYNVIGSVRGLVSRHSSLQAAIRSMEQDQKSCKRLGGGAYSDVRIERADGVALSDAELEQIHCGE